MPRRLPVAVAALTAAGSLLAACGSDTSTAGPTPPSVDSCVVGAWRTVSITGPLTAGGSHVQLVGGAGELLTVHADGTIAIDDRATSPVEGTAADGTAYTLRQTGSGSGRLSASGGRMHVALDNADALTTTVLRNGAEVARQHPGQEAATYTCTRGVQLAITSSGGAISQYSPAG